MYLIKKTSLRPLNGHVLFQRVQDSTKVELAKTLHAKETQPRILTKFVVVAVSSNMPEDIKVGDLIKPYHHEFENLRKDTTVLEIPTFVEHYDEANQMFFETVHYSAIHALEGFSEQGKTWEYDTSEVKKSGIVAYSPFIY